MEDTFGRLPNDVLKYICVDYVIPTIDLVYNNASGIYTLLIKSPLFEFGCEFQGHLYIHYGEYSVKRSIESIDDFINHDSQLIIDSFSVVLDDHSIRIQYISAYIVLPLSCLSQLKMAMQQYRDVLQNKLPKKC